MNVLNICNSIIGEGKIKKYVHDVLKNRMIFIKIVETVYSILNRHFKDNSRIAAFKHDSFERLIVFSVLAQVKEGNPPFAIGHPPLCLAGYWLSAEPPELGLH